ncbi:MAG: glycosyltransferase, partial [Thermoleophilaceae bacterium]|nr:glycosyltransferase [Thermoleophilaceae bacterium]
MSELSVVLVNHDGADVLPRALDALARNTSCEDFEVVVVDSASSDGSWEGLDGARVVRFEDNVGFAAGCNAGARAAEGTLVAFVNFDGEVEPGWDEPLRALLADPGVSIATGLLLRPGGEELEAAGLAIAPNTATFGLKEGEPRSAAPAGPVEVAAASGALTMVRREEFLALGGFYEPIWMYGEEADLALRVPGRIVLHPGSALRHEMGHASGPLRSRLRLYWP